MQKTQPLRPKYWSINAQDLVMQAHKHANSLQQTLPEELGMGYSNIFQLDPDLSYIETQYAPTRDLAILSQIDTQEPRMVITLDLQGQSRFIAHHGQEIVFTEGCTSITTFNSSLGERQYAANSAVTQLRFAITKSWLEKYLDSQHDTWFGNGSVKQLSHRPISQTGLMAAQQLLNNKASGQFKQILMHAQALSILAAELEPLCTEQSASAKRFNAKDQKIAQLAREILAQEFKNPPSVADLAKRLGTNQFKLKQLCHHFYNTTPYGLLADIRMQIAYQMLETGQYHIGVVADFVGYAHASNFSSAFVKYYGVSPKTMVKKYKY